MSVRNPDVCAFELTADERAAVYGQDPLASETDDGGVEYDTTADADGTWHCLRKSLPGSGHDHCVFHTAPTERRTAFNDLDTAKVAQIFLDLVTKPPSNRVLLHLLRVYSGYQPRNRKIG